MHRSTAATLGCCNRHWRTRFDPPEMQTAPLEKLYVNVPAWVNGSIWVFLRETLQTKHRKLLGFTWFYFIVLLYLTSFDNISFKPSVGHLEQALGMWRCGSNSRHYSLQGLDNFVTVTSATASGVWHRFIPFGHPTSGRCRLHNLLNLDKHSLVNGLGIGQNKFLTHMNCIYIACIYIYILSDFHCQP